MSRARPKSEAPESETSGTKTFYALTGDVVGSRELAHRAAVQRTLRDAVSRLNRDLDPEPAASLKVVAGDEVQGLLARPESAVEVVTRIADALHPVRVVWGLGRGPLTTDRSDDVSVLDGPCLHRSREALETAESEGRWVVLRGFGPPHDSILTSLLDLVWTLRSSWTETQMKYARDARSRSQTNVAARHDVSRQAVSKVLDAAHFAVVVDGEEAARHYLRWVSGTLDDPDSTDGDGSPGGRAGPGAEVRRS